MKVSELTKIIEDSTNLSYAVVVRVFINGQYMTSCHILDVYRDDGAKSLVFDADLEVFVQEKK